MNMTNTPSTGSQAPEQPSPKGYLREIVILIVAVGVGVAFAHGAMTGLWPGLTGPWRSALRVLVACFICSLVARFLRWLLGIRRERRRDKGEDQPERPPLSQVRQTDVHLPQAGRDRPMPEGRLDVPDLRLPHGQEG
jgi:hypothetical protein